MADAENKPGKTDSTEAPLEAPPVLDSTPEELPHNTGEKRGFTTAGERIHHWSTYLGIDWFFNTASGVAFSYWGKFSKAGNQYWSGPISRFFDRILTPVVKDPTARAKSAGYGNMFVSIIMGGMFTIPPLLVLESKKVKKQIVQSLDRMIYGKDKVEHDPKFQQAYEEMDNAPKKGFWTGMLARGAALAPLLALALIEPKANPADDKWFHRFKRFTNKYWFDPIAKGGTWVANKMGVSEKSFKSDNLGTGSDRFNYIPANFSMDFGLALPYAAILHPFFYNVFAKLFEGKGNKKAREEDKALPQPQSQITLSSQPPVQKAEEAMPDRESATRKERVQQPPATHAERRAAETSASNALPSGAAL